MKLILSSFFFFFFFNDTATTEIYTLSLHDALPICQGAFYYLTKPVDPLQLQVLLEKSLEQASLTREVDLLRHQLRQKGTYGKLIGGSKGMQAAYRWIELAAKSAGPVFLYGESGTGKEL